MVFNADEEHAKSELIWLFNYADADCGLKSNWSAMVQASMIPGGQWHDPYHPFILKAIDKRREISIAYYALTEKHQHCLYALFGPIPIPFAVEKVYKELAGAIMLVHLTDPKELIRLCQRILQYQTSTQDKLLASQIRMEAVNLRKNALYEYRKARDKRKEKES